MLPAALPGAFFSSEKKRTKRSPFISGLMSQTGFLCFFASGGPAGGVLFFMRRKEPKEAPSCR